jgi:formate/nitrite transporter FocA (FNT family)
MTLSEAKTIGYAAFGTAGLVAVFVKEILSNWMFCLAVVLAIVCCDLDKMALSR